MQTRSLGSHRVTGLCHLVILAAAALSAAAQTPAEPPGLPSFLDVGPISIAPCPCVAAPFSVPWSDPDSRYGTGPAVPLLPAPPSSAERKRLAAAGVEARTTLPSDARAGLAGNPHASIAVAHSYALGVGVERNDERAVGWYHLAARQEHRNAFIHLARQYLHGLGVERDEAAAAYWYYEGAVRGDRNAMVALGLLYAAGRGVASDMQGAFYWMEQASRGGGPALASRFLADAYACGLGVEMDRAAAVRLYTDAASRGERSSQVQLGHMHTQGCGPANDEQAYGWYKRAADVGHPEAQIAMSALLREGRGVEQNVYQAYVWARLAARRLPEGALRRQADDRVAEAARLLSAFEIADAEAFVDATVADAARQAQ